MGHLNSMKMFLKHGVDLPISNTDFNDVVDVVTVVQVEDGRGLAVFELLSDLTEVVIAFFGDEKDGVLQTVVGALHVHIEIL